MKTETSENFDEGMTQVGKDFKAGKIEEITQTSTKTCLKRKENIMKKNMMEPKYTQKIKDSLDEFFKKEDEVLKKIDNKITHLIVPREIDFQKEREELIKLREDLKGKLK